jgi:hypothetical protein
MDKHELEDYRLTLLSEKAAKIQTINLQYDKKLMALDVLLDRDQPSPGKSKAPPYKGAKVASSLIKAVREAIRETGLMGGMSGKFSSETLLKYISEKYPGFAEKPSDLSNPLWRLKKDGEIEVLQQGTGQKPSIYQKTSKFDAAN